MDKKNQYKIAYYNNDDYMKTPKEIVERYLIVVERLKRFETEYNPDFDNINKRLYEIELKELETRLKSKTVKDYLRKLKL